MMKSLPGCALFASMMLAGATATDPLQELLSRFDEAAASFHAMTAGVQYVTHTAVIDDNTEESGTLLMRKVKNTEAQGRIEFTAPDKKTVTFEKSKAQVYLPKAKTLQIYDLGKHGEDLDRFLMMGFGSSGTELARDYYMRVMGSETVRGQKTTKLEMVPKNEEMRKTVSKVELWIPERPSAPYPVQEKIYQSGPGDYRLVSYSNLKINPAITADALKLKVPAGVKTEYPQK